MGERYDRIVEFEDKLHQWTKGLFLEERMIFAEMAELMLYPLEQFPDSSKGKDGEKKSVVLMLISRLFNDLEAAKLLILNGYCEQAYMPLRDTIECTMLLRLFQVDEKRALRWVTRAAEYSPRLVRERLDELGIKVPEHAFYPFWSSVAHANLLGCVTKVRETELGEGTLLRTYHFGGYANERWIGLQLNLALLQMLLALVGPLTEIYSEFFSDVVAWHKKVMETVPRLRKCGLGVGIEYDKPAKSSARGTGYPPVDKMVLKVEQKLFDMGLINEAEPADIPAPSGDPTAPEVR